MCVSTPNRKVILHNHFFTGLFDIPMGTGTLYVKDVREEEEEEEETDFPWPHKRRRKNRKEIRQNADTRLRQEKAGLNVTQREESLVVQYLTLGGFRHWLSAGHQTVLANQEPSMACSGVHSGPGQLSFGYSNKHRADLTLMFPAAHSNAPTIIFVHNYHEFKVHYRGHQIGCPLSQAKTTAEDEECFAGMDEGLLTLDKVTYKLDAFKRGLAVQWSAIRPKKLIYLYTTSTACDFFHGSPIHGETVHTDLEQLLVADYLSTAVLREKYQCRVFVRPPKYSKNNYLDLNQLKADIRDNKIQGFVTIVGGQEMRGLAGTEASDHFGFCVQSHLCSEDQISEFTKRQIAETKGWTLESAELKKYLLSQPARTLNSTTFHSEETLSTSYLSWLMRERHFDNFEITHFLRYQCVNYWNAYLEPLLEARHQHKKNGNAVASSLNKLIQNAYYGRQAMQSSSYDKTMLTTGSNLMKVRKAKMGHLSCSRIVNLGLVRMAHQPKAKKTHSDQLNVTNDFFEAEAMEVREKQSDREKKKPKPRDVIEPFSDSDCGSSDTESEAEAEAETEEGEVGERQRKKYKMHFLYAVTFSGKEKTILNNMPGAVAVLSNSKKLFLGHIHTMLQCADPKLCELCYIDTDSCIFSMTYPHWDDCVRPDRWDLWKESKVMADETGDQSFHGQLKCEGLYRGGLFKTLKIYRLFDPLAKDKYYTRCKGVTRHLAEKLPHSAFDSLNLDRPVVSRTCLKPTAAGQITVTKESRQLAVAFNLKRHVTENGIHTFPISFVAEC